MHVFDPQATSIIDLESFVHHDHFLRKVDRVLESAFVRELTAACYAAGRGRPSIDPEVYVRMLLVAFLYDIRSDRQLCEDVYYNLAYRWFCRLSLQDGVPDHSSLIRIRDRYGEDIFEALFRRIVEICRKRGLTPRRCVAPGCFDLQGISLEIEARRVAVHRRGGAGNATQEMGAAPAAAACSNFNVVHAELLPPAGDEVGETLDPTCRQAIE
jgi:transposase